MKRKILSILVGTMIILNLIGCKPTGSRFIGKWKSEGFVVTYTINKDKTWSWSVPGGLGEYGTWVFNDDWTITLIDEYGNEYWEVRELIYLLEFSKWENFHKDIKRTMIACKASNNNVLNHFPVFKKMVDVGATTKQF